MEAGEKKGFMEDMRVWSELAVTRLFDGMRFVVRWLVGAPQADSSAAPAQPRPRSQSEQSGSSSAVSVSSRPGVVSQVKFDYWALKMGMPAIPTVHMCSRRADDQDVIPRPRLQQ